MSMWAVYFFTRLDNICSFFQIVTCVIIVMYFIISIEVTNRTDEDYFKKLGKKVFPIWLFFCLGALFIPTQKEAAAIWLIPKIVNNERLHNIADSSAAILDKKMIEYLEGLAKDKGQ